MAQSVFRLTTFTILLFGMLRLNFAESHTFEFMLKPRSSIFSGRPLGLGSQFKFAYPISAQVQTTLEVGYIGYTSKYAPETDGFIGLQYFTSSDFTRSTFAGIGLGTFEGHGLLGDLRSVFLRVGHNWKLSDTYDVTWGPSLRVVNTPEGYSFDVELLNFSLFFE